jgi:putative membrane protein|tara:strand:- start:1108 stop:2223 length:1116 start_codon:yes stop_codon:yes gene_type:complete
LRIKDIKTNKLLILCVDRDNDIGDKGQIKTPVVGREDCLRAAAKLALSDPEEADANAIFATVKQFDELVKKGYQCDVAIVAGINTGGFEADKKIRAQVKKIISNSEAEDAILVSDGAEDEIIIPVIQNLIQVVSVKRVIVKHSKSLEETYAVLGRYLKMLIYDPRYSRIALGVPGIFLLLSAVATFFGQERIVSFIALGLIGGTFLIRGFDLDKWINSFPRLKPSGYLRLFSSMASILIIATSVFTAFVAISGTEAFQSVQADPNLIWVHGAFLLGKFIQEALMILWIGIGVYFIGAMLVNYLKGNIRIIGYGVGLVTLALLYFPMFQFSGILMGTGSTTTLISFLLVGVAVIFLIVTIVYMYIQSRRNSE